MHSTYYQEELTDMLDIDTFYGKLAPIDDLPAIVTSIASSIGDEPAVTEEEWRSLKKFGVDTDQIQEAINRDFADMIQDTKNMLESLKSLLDGMTGEDEDPDED